MLNLKSISLSTFFINSRVFLRSVYKQTSNYMIALVNICCIKCKQMSWESKLCKNEALNVNKYTQCYSYTKVGVIIRR